MYKVLKIIFILFLTAIDLLSVFILFDEIRSNGMKVFDDRSLLILVSLLILSIPAFIFQYRTLRIHEFRLQNEKNILDVPIDATEEDEPSIRGINRLLWLGNAAFGLEVFILGILAGMLILENLQPLPRTNPYYLRILLVLSLLFIGMAMMIETWVTWIRLSEKNKTRR
ncbi:MAG: hypothetical protein DWQ02_11265 [Bacteroidetes bacterium]|nr:MAG: hypothetical protein DWQ02_11265 [Bacteroidota bacterium]